MIQENKILCIDCGKPERVPKRRICVSCFKKKDNERGVKLRERIRAEKGKIKPSSEITETRQCSVCMVFKNTEQCFFFITRKGVRQPNRVCKSCKAEYCKNYRLERRDKYAEYSKKSRLRDPEKHREYVRLLRKSPKHRETARKYSKSRAEAGWYRDYYRTPEGRIAALNKRERHRARKEGALTENSHLITKKWTTELFSKYENKCVYCLRISVLEMDHIVPVSRGGKHEPSNIVPSCKSCNSSKCDMLVNEWRPSVVIPAYGLDLPTG